MLGRPPRWWVRNGAAAASGLLLAFAYPPFDLGPIALVALVPLLWAWHDAGPWRAAGLGLLAGLAFFGITLAWLTNVGVVAALPLMIALAAYWAIAGALIGALGRLGVRAPWVTAAAWVILEAARGRWPLGGMAWAEAGAALHDVSAARALASFGGVPLVAFLVVAGNAFLLDALLAWRRRGARPPLVAALGGLVAVGLVTVAAVITRFDPTPTGRIRFALLQGNDQDRRLTPEEIASGYLTERHLALTSRLHGRYDLIVFPEAALETDPETDPLLRARIVDVAREHRSAVLVNAITTDRRGRRYNTNRLYDPSGRLQGSYRKQHLVPFGEYVPWRGSLSFIGELQQVPTDFTRGHHTRVFDVGGRRVGNVICFESAFSPLVRRAVEKGAELVVVSTNNRSYRRSALSEQHLATSQMRAAETGRPVLHAAVSGITGVVDASGRVVRSNGLFHNAVVAGEVTTTRGETPYVRFGDWVVWGSGLGLLASLAIGLSRRRLSGTSRTAAAPTRSPIEPVFGGTGTAGTAPADATSDVTSDAGPDATERQSEPRVP